MSLTDCIVPDSVKERLHDKLSESKALDAIDARVKQGMCGAIEHLRGNKTSNPLFKDLGFQKPESEIRSLQVIYKDLASVKLIWALETISQETNVAPKTTEETPSLTDLLQYPRGKPQQEEEPVKDEEVQGEAAVNEEEDSEVTELDQEEEEEEIE
jgi:hypothetical protein